MVTGVVQQVVARKVYLYIADVQNIPIITSCVVQYCVLEEKRELK